MVRRKIVRNAEQCTGCSLCVVACSMANFGVFSLHRSYIALERDDKAQRFAGWNEHARVRRETVERLGIDAWKNS